MKKGTFLFVCLLGAAVCRAQETISKKANEETATRQNFDYNMAHGEVFSQLCSIIPIRDVKKTIAARLPPGVFTEASVTWSDRQRAFFRANRKSVIRWMHEDIWRLKEIGTNYKLMIVELDDVEIIPLLYDKYFEDRDVLTMLMLLMKQNEYAPFLGSKLYKDLYSGPGESWSSKIDWTPENEAAIIRLANRFYIARLSDPQSPEFSYELYRETLSFPPYDSAKIAKLVRDEVKKEFEEKEKTRKHEPASNDDDSDKVFTIWHPYLSPEAYGKLNLRERYVYSISYPEDYVQNCGALHVGGGSSDKIGAQLPFFYQGVYLWSRAQDRFFRDNKDSVLAWITADVERTGRVGLNYKHAIIVCGDRKIIPLLIKTYERDNIDHDILTVLLLWMEKAKYPPFLRSDLYNALYGPQSNRRSEIKGSPDNVKAILALAKEYYAGDSHGQ